MKRNVTFVTGLWNIGRDDLNSFKRSFDNYLSCFEILLSLDINLVVYVPEELKDFVTNAEVQTIQRLSYEITKTLSLGLIFMIVLISYAPTQIGTIKQNGWPKVHKPNWNYMHLFN